MEAKTKVEDYLRRKISEKFLEYLNKAIEIGETTKESRDLMVKAKDLENLRLAFNKGGLEKMTSNYHTLMNKNEGGNK